jgi:signal peptidase I
VTEAVESAPGPWTAPVRQRPWGAVAGAFVLNLVLPPVGYVFVGRWKLALAFLVFLAVSAIGALAWTFQSPPGIYRWLSGPLSYVALTWCVTLPFALHAAWIAYGAPYETSMRRPGVLFHLAFAASPLILMGLIRAFVPLSVYQIPSASMNPTLQQGDFLAVNSARAFCGQATPAVGDVIIHRQGATLYVKRVVAGPGQVVAMRQGLLSIDGKVAVQRVEGEGLVVDNGPFSVTGRIVRETLPNGRHHQTLDLAPDTQFDNFGPVTVPAGAWFALGDNRDNSLDSRANGSVPQKDICGVVAKVLKSKRAAEVGVKP